VTQGVACTEKKTDGSSRFISRHREQSGERDGENVKNGSRRAWKQWQRAIADRPPYAAVSCRRLSFPGRRYLQCLERLAPPGHHDGTIPGCLPQSPQDAPLQALLSIMPFRWCAREVTLVIVGHINRFFLLTYLLIYLQRNAVWLDQQYQQYFYDSKIRRVR